MTSIVASVNVNLQKWNDTSSVENVGKLVVDNKKFLPKLSQNLFEILDDDEYYDITIEVGNDPHVKIFRANMAILNYRSPFYSTRNFIS